MLDQAGALDEAPGQAVEQAERIATEQERHRHTLPVHDASLQVLEAVAGGWELDDEDLFRRIDFETARCSSCSRACHRRNEPTSAWRCRTWRRSSRCSDSKWSSMWTAYA